MLTNQRIICISSIDWDFLWQQHQEIMSTYARHRNTVLFIENTGVRAPRLSDIPRLLHRLKNWRKSLWGFRKESDYLYIYSPLVLPFPHSRIARGLNRWIIVASLKWWMRSANFHDPILWTFLPTRIVLDIAEAIDHQLLVYYATDNFSATSKGARKVVRTEPEIIRRADLVFVNSYNRLEYCRQFRDDVIQIPMGVSAEVFEEAKQSTMDRPAELKEMTTPIIGYVGGVRQSIDQQLVRRVAEEMQGCHLVFVGPLQTDMSSLRPYANVHFLGEKSHREMPRYIQSFACCMIPYVKDAYTDSVSAAKLHEYLIMGKPVVSTNITEVARLAAAMPDNIVYVARDHQEFINALRNALHENGKSAEQRIALAREHAWSRIIETMSSHISEKLRLLQSAPLEWQQQFLAMYRRATRRLVSVVTVVAAVYLLAFHSPLTWWLASPLKVVQAPTSSDAIVVFAGGVGESGSAGEGCQERVKQAVALYQQGYARHLIFSSGYLFVFQEPEIMRALAIELGVPASSILLETRAKNTMENVSRTAEVVRRNGWRNILLVSSPYHMRRALLTWRKLAPDITVIPTPVSHSQFYAHRHGATPKQIQGIIHEYAGIVLYLWKGWI